MSDQGKKKTKYTRRELLGHAARGAALVGSSVAAAG